MIQGFKDPVNNNSHFSESIIFKPSNIYLALNAISKSSPVLSHITFSFTEPISEFELIWIFPSVTFNFTKFAFSTLAKSEALSKDDCNNFLSTTTLVS